VFRIFLLYFHFMPLFHIFRSYSSFILFALLYISLLDFADATPTWAGRQSSGGCGQAAARQAADRPAARQAASNWTDWRVAGKHRHGCGQAARAITIKSGIVIETIPQMFNMYKKQARVCDHLLFYLIFMLRLHLQ
jgi:hypothetical protein